MFEDLISEYQIGLTPNPDIQCNKHLKFGHFHKYCMQTLGCDAVATGTFIHVYGNRVSGNRIPKACNNRKVGF